MLTEELFNVLLKLNIINNRNLVFEPYDMLGFDIFYEYEQIIEGKFEGDTRLCDGWKVGKVQGTLN